MKKLSIVREELRKGNFASAKINVEKNDKEEDMSKELGDFLFKLLKYAEGNNNGNKLDFVANVGFKMSLSLNFIIRENSSQKIIREVSTLFQDTISRTKAFYYISEINLVILEEEEEYISSVEEVGYDKVMYLKGANVAWRER